jgi:hypothetical protein
MKLKGFGLFNLLIFFSMFIIGIQVLKYTYNAQKHQLEYMYSRNIQLHEQSIKLYIIQYYMYNIGNNIGNSITGGASAGVTFQYYHPNTKKHNGIDVKATFSLDSENHKITHYIFTSDFPPVLKTTKRFEDPNSKTFTSTNATNNKFTSVNTTKFGEDK